MLKVSVKGLAERGFVGGVCLADGGAGVDCVFLGEWAVCWFLVLCRFWCNFLGSGVDRFCCVVYG